MADNLLNNTSMILLSILTTLFLLAGSPVVASCGKTVADNTALEKEEKQKETGEVVLLYMGQASIRIVTETNHVIYIDPYAGNQYDLAADLILVTHEHFDHNKLDLVKRRQKDCRIIRARDAITADGHRYFDFGYVKVQAVEAGFNRYHDKRNCVGYVLTFNNGKKVYVSGDTSITEEMSRMSGLNIDYAFLCTDGWYNMGNEEAARAARMIGAKHNIPYHNDTSNTGEMFDREMAAAFDAPNKMIVLPGETIMIGEMDEKQEVEAFIRNRNKAMCEQDTLSLSRMMADDLMLVHMSGAKQSKSSWLKDIADGTMRYYNINMQKLDIEVDGDRATAKMTSAIEARIWGSHGKWTLSSTMHLRKTNSGWLWTND